MGEKKPSIEELSERIDQLLNILNIISRDLSDISKTLREVSVPAAVPTGRIRTIEDVRMLFSEDLRNMLMFEEMGEYIIVKPRQYLGSENFAKIASIVREEDGEYISAGRESHFRLPKEIS